MSKKEDHQKKNFLLKFFLEKTGKYVVLTVKTATLIDPNGFEKITSKYPPRDYKVLVRLVHFFTDQGSFFFWSLTFFDKNREENSKNCKNIVKHLENFCSAINFWSSSELRQQTLLISGIFRTCKKGLKPGLTILVL